MKRPGRVIAKIARYASVAMLFIAALLLIFWPLAQKVVPLSAPTQLFGLCVALLASLILELTRRIGQQEVGDFVQIQRTSIGGAIRAAVDQRKTVTTLRILASTTETILPALRDTPIRIKSCRVMVHDFSSRVDAEGKARAAKSDSLIATWSELPQHKVAEEVTVKRVQFEPTFFVVIFDDRALIHGLYVPSARRTSAVHYLEPMIVENQSLASQAIIDTFIRQFDDIFDDNQVFARSVQRRR
jgi:hypothetical protein